MTAAPKLSTHLPLAPPTLGVLSIHLDGARCRVGCEFCYLGERTDGEGHALDGEMLDAILARLAFEEVAVAVSEPASLALAPLARIARAAAARGKPLSITTTAAVLATEPGLLEGVTRVNLSVDPRKGSTSPKLVALAARRARAEGREVVLIASLTTPEWAEELIAGRLAEYLALDGVDKIALNALKPPPPWCGRDFWLRTCARLAPLLAEHLDRRLFLDCWVAARILHLGGCPARPDVSPGRPVDRATESGALGAGGGPAFRSCVYQPSPDFHFATVDELAERLAHFTAPAVCPFPIPE